MNPRLKIILGAIAGIALGIYVSVDLADESYGLAALVVLACAWLAVARITKVPIDALLLAVALVGYIVGNRGFAQLQPAEKIPLLPAEAVLGVSVGALLFRVAMKRERGYRNDLINIAILVWALIGTIRLPLDAGVFGFIALRDYAMIYYCGFFFVAQSLASVEPASRVLRSSLSVAFVALIPAVVFVAVAPDLLYDNFTWHGVPLIFHKSDLIATSLAAGFFWLWSRGVVSGRIFWYLAAGASLLLIGTMASPRAAMAAVAITTVLWLAVGRWRILAAQGAFVVAGTLLALAYVLLSGKDLKTSAPYSAYEHAMSIFDPEGTGSYVNAESGDPGDNNRFRIVWWKSVIGETVETSPVFGLGFGTDLAAKFLADYGLIADEAFSARSPHSIIVTVFGRMGFAGLLAWLALMAGIGRLAWRLFKKGDVDGMGLVCVALVTGLSGCVGVVLEGPMGAIVFWTALGLANARDKPEAKTAARQAEESPIANPGAHDTQSSLR
jgi:hypothetical protein